MRGEGPLLGQLAGGWFVTESGQAFSPFRLSANTTQMPLFNGFLLRADSFFRERRSLRVLSCFVGIAVWKTRDFCLVEFHDDILTGPHQAFGAGDQFDGVSFVVEMHRRLCLRTLIEMRSKYIA